MLKKLKSLLQKETPEEILDNAVFVERVGVEMARIGAHRAGVLAVEAATITEHLTLADKPAVRDLVDLRAVTLLLILRYQYHPLEELTGAADYTAMRTAFDQYFALPLSDGTSWGEHLVGATAALHSHEMETLPLEWLMEWQPSEPRLDAAKVALLPQARLRTLTTLLLMLAEREVALLEEGAAVLAAPNYKAGTLWHSVTDTRQMRFVVADAWGARAELPIDYRRAVVDKSPMQQMAVLREKQAAITEICERQEALLKVAPPPETFDGELYR